MSCDLGHCAANCGSGHGTPCMQSLTIPLHHECGGQRAPSQCHTRALAPPAVLITLRSSGRDPGSGRSGHEKHRSRDVHAACRVQFPAGFHVFGASKSALSESFVAFSHTEQRVAMGVGSNGKGRSVQTLSELRSVRVGDEGLLGLVPSG